MTNIEVWIEELDSKEVVEPEASPEEIKTVHSRYIGLTREYGADIKVRTNVNTQTGEKKTIYQKHTRAETTGVKGGEPFMEFHISSDAFPVPDDLRDPAMPLPLPDDAKIIFSVKLKKPQEMFPYKRATFYIDPDKIRWGVAEGMTGIGSTKAKSSDCQNLLNLAEYYEQMKSKPKLKGGTR